MATIPVAGAQWFGHPRQLARLFTTEAMERFGYYGLRALLTLYLADHFLFSDATTTSLYGGFTALVYLTPLVGGLLADRYLGAKRSVKFGALVMAAGYLTLAFGGDAATPFATIDGQRFAVAVDRAGPAKQRYVLDGGRRLAIRGNDDGSVTLTAPDGRVARTVAAGRFVAGGDRSRFYTLLMLAGLSAVTVGNGFFKPNISTMVGSLYATGDRRRDAGFTIFYMGINLGSLFSQILCPLLAVGGFGWAGIGWWAGFALAACGMVVSWGLIQFAGSAMAGIGETPVAGTGGRDRSLVIYALTLAAIPLVWLLFINLMNAPPPAKGAGFLGQVAAMPVLGQVLVATFTVAVIGIPLWALAAGSRAEFEMMLAAIVLVVFNIVFWALFEQAGSSLTLFADRNTDMSVFGLFTLSAGQTQFFNAFFIVILAPLFSAMWLALARRGREPGIPVKFGFALIGVGAGFLFLVLGTRFAGPDFKVAIWWLAGLYLIHSMAELCISPVGLSMITKLSIARIVGMMMGVWFLSISFAQYIGGVIASVASVETVGGQVTNLKISLDTYAQVFQTIGLIAVAIGVVLLALSVVLKHLMHGVD